MKLRNLDSWIENPKTGERKQIVLDGFPLKAKDLLIGGSLISLGIGYLTYRAYRKGALAFEHAECKTLEELGLFK